MPRLIAFLRAINVGGRRATRDQLTSCLDSLGFENVTTFRASGNLIFDARRQPETALTKRIDDALTESLGYDVCAFLRTAADVQAIAAHTPFPKKIVDASGATVYSGTLTQRADVGYLYTPTPYQKVYEADFSAFNTPGQYRLVVPGMGASLPFTITDGIAMNFARAYALGLYHQRCGTDNVLPFTRFVHGPCHTGAAEVPDSSSKFESVNHSLSKETANYKDNSRHTAPQLKDVAADLYPFVKQNHVRKTFWRGLPSPAFPRHAFC
jgi:hypothetical protein